METRVAPTHGNVTARGMVKLGELWPETKTNIHTKAISAKTLDRDVPER
jgi:hypothetical protein